MNIRKLIRQLIEEKKNSATDRLHQIDKIIDAYETGSPLVFGASGNSQTKLCHYKTGSTIKKRNNMSDYVVLVGTSPNTIYHSYLIDNNGTALIPGNPDIQIGDNTVDIAIDGKNQITFPYVEFIHVKNLLNGNY